MLDFDSLYVPTSSRLLCGKLTTGEEIVVVDIDGEKDLEVMQSTLALYRVYKVMATGRYLEDRFKDVGYMMNVNRETGAFARAWLEYDLVTDPIAHEMYGFGSRIGLKRVTIYCEALPPTTTTTTMHNNNNDSDNDGTSQKTKKKIHRKKRRTQKKKKTTQKKKKTQKKRRAPPRVIKIKKEEEA